MKKVRTSSHVQDNVGQTAFISDETQLRWFESLLTDESRLYAIFELNAVPIGYIRITDIDYTNRSMCVGGDIEEEICGQGHGRAMYGLIFMLGFDVWNMNRLWLKVLEHNTRARRLYKKMGFTEEGVQREAIYKNGKYEDYITMSILRREYNDTLI